MVLTTNNIKTAFDEFSTVRVTDHGTNYVYISFINQRQDVLSVTLHRNVWRRLKNLAFEEK